MEFWEWNAFFPFGFVIALVLIGSVFSYLKQRSRNETLKELVRSGQPIDPDLLKEVNNEDSGGGQITGGFITIAVGVALVFLAYQINSVEGDEEIIPIMLGVASFPILIGVVLVISGFASKRKRG